MGWKPEDDDDDDTCHHAPIPVHIAVETLQATSPAEGGAASQLRLLAMTVIADYLKSHQDAKDGRDRRTD